MGSLELSQKEGAAQKRGLHFGGGASEKLLTMGFRKKTPLL